jgi:hypothetical protein
VSVTIRDMHCRSSWPAAIRVLLILACVSVLACVPMPASLTGPPVASPTSLDEAPITSAGPTGPAGPTPVPSFVRPTPLPAPTFLTYTVKAGDTLTSIARAFQTTARSIAFWSRTEHPSLDPEADGYRPDRLEIGWVLLVIPGTTFDEDDLPDATPSPTSSAAPGSDRSPTAS